MEVFTKLSKYESRLDFNFAILNYMKTKTNTHYKLQVSLLIIIR